MEAFRSISGDGRGVGIGADGWLAMWSEGLKMPVRTQGCSLSPA